jgi:SAM-dependent methyltransferase
MIEFTGERVVPGQVESDLWNEHYARYLFASRLSRARWVADLGCGTGYGSALLARSAAEVHAIDVAPEAIAYAREHHSAPNLHFSQASCTALPFAPESFDLVVAFEVIEHLENWNDLLSEASRVLAPGGQFVVSTPNLAYYAATREQSGPNPYHTHEFTYDEFRAALTQHFPDVRLFAQNHVAGLAFQPLESAAGSELRIDNSLADPASCHFFLAVCARSPQMGAPVYVYIPRTTNVLGEREEHIHRLEGEVAQKSQWLAAAQTEHQELLARHEALQTELEERNRWADDLTAQMRADQASHAALVEQHRLLTEELETRNRWAENLSASLKEKEQQHADLVLEIEGKNQWAHQLEDRLAQAASRIQDLEAIEAERNELIERARRQTEEIEAKNRWALDLEARVGPLESEITYLRQELEDRTRWAQSLDDELAQLRASFEPILAERDEAHQSFRTMSEQAAALERELDSRTAWVHSLDAQFQAKSQELARCVELLERAEATVVERTEWAQRAQTQIERLLADLEAARSEANALRERIGLVAGSRWLKLGRSIGVGPRIEGGARS